VLGLPIREDGTEGTAAGKIRLFAKKLATKLPPGTPIVFQDEYRTTEAAKERLRAAGKKEKNFRKIIDQAAAVEILQEYLYAQGLGRI
jgi:putative holliday junction resolvase